jgi:hypothetical protein
MVDIRPCVITWTEEDVRGVVNDWKAEAIELTDKEINSVLRSMEETHDATIGINWDTIEFWIDNIINKRGMN